MKRLIPVLLLSLLGATATLAQEPRAFDYFKPFERSHPLVLPGTYSLSKFGRGLYRIDTFEFSRGRLNCLFLTFTATAPEGTTAAPKLAWKTEHTEAEGEKIVRLTAVLANPFDRAVGADGDVLTVRIDALNDDVAAKLRAIAEELLTK